MSQFINKIKDFFKEIKGESKKLWKFFVFLFLISFIIINWSDISWIFNHKVIWRQLSDFFEKNKTQATEMFDEKKAKTDYFDNEGSIEIPKIGVKAPIVFSENNSEEDFEMALKKGVLHYPESALPAEEGTIVILGHSAPPNWPKIDYDWVFNDLNELSSGDEIYIYFNQSQYIYRVTQQFFLNPGQNVPQSLTNSKYMLNLLSCWPPGKDQKRIAVEAELIR